VISLCQKLRGKKSQKKNYPGSVLFLENKICKNASLEELDNCRKGPPALFGTKGWGQKKNPNAQAENPFFPKRDSVKDAEGVGVNDGFGVEGIQIAGGGGGGGGGVGQLLERGWSRQGFRKNAKGGGVQSNQGGDPRIPPCSIHQERKWLAAKPMSKKKIQSNSEKNARCLRGMYNEGNHQKSGTPKKRRTELQP